MAITRRGLAATGLLLQGTRTARAQTQWQAVFPWPAANPFSVLLQRFCDEVREGSGGALQISRAPAADQLKSHEIRQALQSGLVQLADMSLAANARGEPLLELDAVPMLARTPAQARRLAAVSRPLVESWLQRDGVTLLYWLPWSGAGLFSRFTIDSVAALRGTRMRTLTAMGARTAALCGATVAQVETQDVPRAFASRQASVMLTSAITGVESEAWNFATYFTTLSASLAKSAVCVQSRALEALSPPRRALLREVARRCETAGWDGLEAAQDAAGATLAACGMAMPGPSDRLVEDFERIGGIMLDEWTERAGAPGQRLLDAYREG